MRGTEKKTTPGTSALGRALLVELGDQCVVTATSPPCHHGECSIAGSQVGGFHCFSLPAKAHGAPQASPCLPRAGGDQQHGHHGVGTPRLPLPGACCQDTFINTARKDEPWGRMQAGTMRRSVRAPRYKGVVTNQLASCCCSISSDLLSRVSYTQIPCCPHLLPFPRFPGLGQSGAPRITPWTSAPEHKTPPCYPQAPQEDQAGPQPHFLHPC